jgi:hypothetical protein
MPWIRLTSSTGGKLILNMANLVVIRPAYAFDGAQGARSAIWMQAGKAQVKQLPADIVNQLPPGLDQADNPGDSPVTGHADKSIYFNPDACTEIIEFFEHVPAAGAARTKVRTAANEDFEVEESVDEVYTRFGGKKIGSELVAAVSEIDAGAASFDLESMV